MRTAFTLRRWLERWEVSNKHRSIELSCKGGSRASVETGPRKVNGVVSAWARRLLVLASVVMFGMNLAVSQTSWKGVTSTNWNTATNWTNGVPTSTVDAIIGDASFTGANQPSITRGSNCNNLTLGAGAVASTLSISTSGVTVSGSITIGAVGTINHTAKGTLTVKGNWSNSGVYNASNNNARVTFAGTTQSLIGATTFRKLTINAGSTTTIQAAITARTLAVSGTFDPNEPTYLVTGGSSGTLTVNSGGVLRVKASTFAGNYNANSITLNTGSTVSYSASTINQTVSNSFTYSTLRISGATTKTLAGSLPSLESGSATNGNIYVDGGVLDLLSFTANRGTSVAGGNFNVANGATLKIGGTNSFPSNYANVLLGSTSTIEYGGTNQSVSAQVYGNLTLSSSSGAAVKTMPASAMTLAGNLVSTLGSGSSVSFTAGNSINVDGSVTIGASTTYNGGSFTHNVLSNWTNNGTFSGSTGKVVMGGTNKVLSGTGTHNFNTLEISGSGVTVPGTVVLTIGGSLTAVGAGTITHASSGTVTMTGSTKTINGAGIFLHNLSVTGSVTALTSFNVSGNISLSGSGTLSASSGIVTMSGASKTITNSGSGNLALYGLSVIGSVTASASISMSSDLSVTGALSATAGTISFIGTSSFSGVANLFNVTLNGTSLHLGGNSVLGVAGAFTRTAGTFDVTSTTPNRVDYNSTGAQSVLGTTYDDVSFSAGGTKTAAGSLTVNGNVLINVNATFNGGTYTHSLYGDWINNGAYAAGSSTVQLVGVAYANISGNNPTTFNTLTLNKALTGDLLTINTNTVVGTLNATSGLINIPDTSKSITFTTTRTGSGIIIGKITRTHVFSNSVAYAFEGPNNLLTFTGGGTNPTSVTMKVLLSGPTDFSPAGTTVQRTYEISQTGGAGYAATLRLHYEENELNGNDEPLMDLQQYVSGGWNRRARTGIDVNANWVEKHSLGDVSGRWTIQSPIPGIIDWSGAVSGVWENPANWNIVSGSPALPPDDTTYVRVGFVPFTNQPTVSSTVRIRSLSFGSVQAATFTLASGSNFTISGSIGNLVGAFDNDVTHSIIVGNQNFYAGGNMGLSDGVLNRRINISVANGSVNVRGNLNHLGNSDLSISGTGTLTIGGNWTRASTATFSAGTGMVTIDGPANQIVAGGVTYHHLKISKPAGIASMSGTTSVNGNFVIDSTSGSVQLSSVTLTIGGNLSIGTGTTLDLLGGTTTVGGNVTRLGTFNGAGSTFVLNGTGDQSVSPMTF